MSAKIQPLRPSKPPPRRLDLAPVIAGLRHSRDISHNIRLGGKVTEVPSAASIAEALEGIVTSLFPTHLGPHGLSPDTVDHFVRNTLSTSFDRLGDQIGRGLQFDSRGLSVQDAQREADVILDGLAQRLPEVRGLLVSDLKSARQQDGSAQSLAEVLICHPSTRAIIHYRIAHSLHELGARFVARIVSALAQATTGIDIHPGARIGAGLFIGRGMGVVIGETAILGNNVCLHQGVTLGEAEMPKASGIARRPRRHPVIEDNVVIHAGASILGRITVGAGSIIGGNVWLTRSVPPGSTVTQAAHDFGAISCLD